MRGGYGVFLGDVPVGLGVIVGTFRRAAAALARMWQTRVGHSPMVTVVLSAARRSAGWGRSVVVAGQGDA